MTIQFRTINALFNQRFLLGMYAPIVLEFVVYAIYLTAKGEPLNWGILFWALMAIAPALFIYIISPILIYYISGIGKHYKQNLQDHIDSLFIFSGDLEGMDEKTKDEIYKKIDNQLIPKLVNNLRFTYIDSYISRSRHSQKEILFTNFETLFLFSITWSILSLFDFIGVIILHFQPIVLDFIVIDTID
ncbi:MAG: hypothetical protein U9O98_10005, partial [Asgard group archaeon]|nr:hypothetical protein [Asgard group archaeon]